VTIDVIQLGERFDLTRTFTAIEGGEALVDVSATCTMLAPDGELLDVNLDAVVIDNDVEPPTATFTGSFLPPRESAKFGIWTEEWLSSDDLEDVAIVWWYAPRNPVLVAQDAASS
jgi:hypothetical protein